MRKIFFLAAFAFLFSGSLQAPVHAINLGLDRAGDAAVEAGYSYQTNETTFAETLGVVVRTALSFIGVIALILMVYAGYLWMTARGDETKVDKAVEIIRSTIIGLVIATAAFSITGFVLPRILNKTSGPVTGPIDGDGNLGTGSTSNVCYWSGSPTDGSPASAGPSSGSQTDQPESNTPEGCAAWCCDRAGALDVQVEECLFNGQPISPRC